MDSLVFDVDGVIADSWTPVENAMHSWAKLSNGHRYASYIEYVSNKGSIADFAATFDFESCITDFNMTILSAEERACVTRYFRSPEIFENILPMYDAQNKVSGYSSKLNWLDVSLSPQGSNWGDVRPSFRDWAVWLQSLTPKYAVLLHTHVYTDEMSCARRVWFEREIKPYAPDVKLRIDVGLQKSQLSGTLVFEDSLDNLLKANATIKVLRNTFHNSYKSSINLATWKDFDTTGLVCVSNFKEIQAVVAAWEEYLERCDKPEKRLDPESLVCFNDILERRIE